MRPPTFLAAIEAGLKCKAVARYAVVLIRISRQCGRASTLKKLSPGRAKDRAMELVEEQNADEKNRRAGAESSASRPMMTLQEVANYLRVTRSTIHRLLKRNQIPGFRIGRHWRFNVEEIDKWCSSRVSTKDPKADA